MKLLKSSEQLLLHLHVITKDASDHIVILEADSRRCIGSNVSTSSTAPVDATADSSEEEEPQFLKVIAAKDFGAEELVGCQRSLAAFG
ncbi:hypothetical protein MUK42_32718 [Musa troglodytarum]|uniref:Uncharacterized protein n=1 Tax=Musa troglodytarum TaxID=320322 RepID=A0A9E7LEK2_9LILI|nr:hypothetical protein MUK42_32718 [Musa troglodytarum]